MYDPTVTLQIPGEKLSPNNLTGVFIDEPSVLVKSSNQGSQTWSMDKLNCRLDDMVGNGMSCYMLMILNSRLTFMTKLHLKTLITQR